MAIIDNSKTSFINDNDENIFIGIENKFIKGDIEGWFKSTKTTINAVKQNIRSILKTEKGERLMQPNLGISLRTLLFNPVDEGTNILIQEEITGVMAKYFPFVTITDIEVNNDGEDVIGKALVQVKISFMINNNPNLLDTIEVEFEGEY